MRYSALKILAQGLVGNRGWRPLWREPEPKPAYDVAIDERLAGAAYTTDQTDVWVALRIAGPRVRPALERVCPIDLLPEAFPEGSVARTVMEHLGTIIVRDGTDSFLLLSARSSADSFLHVLHTSIRNIA